MVKIIRVLARVFVESIDDALPLYRRLADGAAPIRFAFGDVELATVGPFLLLAGPPETLDVYRDRVASLVVADIDAVVEEITSAGGTCLDGPAPGPNGPRLIARHPDGAVFEYLQLDDA